MADIFDKDLEDTDIKIEDNNIRIGDDINITRRDPALRNLHVGMGWDLNAFDADALDLDLSCFLLDKNEMTRADEDFVFYNNEETCGGAVRHHGDSRHGAGEGDDESMAFDLHGIPFDVMRVAFVLSVYQGLEKEQTLGMVRNAYIRIANADTMHEIARYHLENDIKGKKETGMIVAYLDREGPKWHFRPVGKFALRGLTEIATKYGIIVQGE